MASTPSQSPVSTIGDGRTPTKPLLGRMVIYRLKIRQEGILTKQGRLFRNWKSRHFRLENRTLRYYKNPPRAAPKNTCNLQQAVVLKGTPKSFSRPPALKAEGWLTVYSRQGTRLVPLHVLYVENAETRDAWLTAVDARRTLESKVDEDGDRLKDYHVCGFVTRTDSTGAQWKRMHMVHSRANRTLEFFDKSPEDSAQGSIPLAGNLTRTVNVYLESELDQIVSGLLKVPKSITRSNIFALDVSDTSAQGSSRLYLFEASSQEERSAWVRALQKVIYAAPQTPSKNSTSLLLEAMPGNTPSRGSVVERPSFLTSPSAHSPFHVYNDPICADEPFQWGFHSDDEEDKGADGAECARKESDYGATGAVQDDATSDDDDRVNEVVLHEGMVKQRGKYIWKNRFWSLRHVIKKGGVQDVEVSFAKTKAMATRGVYEARFSCRKLLCVRLNVRADGKAMDKGCRFDLIFQSISISLRGPSFVETQQWVTKLDVGICMCKATSPEEFAEGDRTGRLSIAPTEPSPNIVRTNFGVVISLLKRSMWNRHFWHQHLLIYENKQNALWFAPAKEMIYDASKLKDLKMASIKLDDVSDLEIGTTGKGSKEGRRFNILASSGDVHAFIAESFDECRQIFSFLQSLLVKHQPRKSSTLRTAPRPAASPSDSPDHTFVKEDSLALTLELEGMEAWAVNPVLVMWVCDRSRRTGSIATCRALRGVVTSSSGVVTGYTSQQLWKEALERTTQSETSQSPPVMRRSKSDVWVQVGRTELREAPIVKDDELLRNMDRVHRSRTYLGDDSPDRFSIDDRTQPSRRIYHPFHIMVPLFHKQDGANEPTIHARNWDQLVCSGCVDKLWLRVSVFHFPQAKREDPDTLNIQAATELAATEFPMLDVLHRCQKTSHLDIFAGTANYKTSNFLSLYQVRLKATLHIHNVGRRALEASPSWGVIGRKSYIFSCGSLYPTQFWSNDENYPTTSVVSAGSASDQLDAPALPIKSSLLRHPKSPMQVGRRKDPPRRARAHSFDDLTHASPAGSFSPVEVGLSPLRGDASTGADMEGILSNCVLRERLLQSAFAFTVPALVLKYSLRSKRKVSQFLSDLIFQAQAQLVSMQNLSNSVIALVKAGVMTHPYIAQCVLIQNLQKTLTYNTKLIECQEVLLDFYNNPKSFSKEELFSTCEVPFKASTKKKSDALRYVATNLHLHTALVEHLPFGSSPTQVSGAMRMAIYDTVSVGAFADHAAGFKKQGRIRELDASVEENRRQLLDVQQAMDTCTSPALFKEMAEKRSALEQQVQLQEIDLLERKEAIFSQALSTLVTVFVAKLQLCLFHSSFFHSPAVLVRIARIGFLFQVESLLSTIRKEACMLTDFEFAVRQLQRVKFRLLRRSQSDSTDQNAEDAQPDCQADSVEREDGPSIDLVRKIRVRFAPSSDTTIPATAAPTSTTPDEVSRRKDPSEPTGDVSVESQVDDQKRHFRDHEVGDQDSEDGDLSELNMFEPLPIHLRQSITQIENGSRGDPTNLQDSIKRMYGSSMGSTQLEEPVLLRNSSGQAEKLTVVLELPDEMFSRIPPEIISKTEEDGGKCEIVNIDVYAALISQGVNEMQSVANTLGIAAQQKDVNCRSLHTLQSYARNFIKYTLLHPDENSPTVISNVQGVLDGLTNMINSGNKGKDILLLRVAHRLCRLLCGGRVVSCKSAKDRTSMSITWETASSLHDWHGVSTSLNDEQTIMDLTRTYGVRRQNVLKNTGRKFYAFNGLQRAMLPHPLRPPDVTCGKTVS